MKKRLLITSIVMMLVVAVALSTATYAWFTSSNAVTASTLLMRAAVNTDSAMEISYVNTEGNWLTNIEANSSSLNFEPAAIIIADEPEALTLHGTGVTGEIFDDLDWQSATVINNKFNAAPSSNNRYIWQDDDNHESFFLHNGSTANPINNINVTATITGTAQSFIRIAIFKKITASGANQNKFELYGILSNQVLYTKATSWSEGTKYYTAAQLDFVAATEQVSDPGTTYASEQLFEAALESGMLYTRNAAYTGVAVAEEEFDTTSLFTNIIEDETISVKTISIGGLGVNDNDEGGDDEMELKVAVWMDGSALNDDTAGATNKTASITLTFAAA